MLTTPQSVQSCARLMLTRIAANETISTNLRHSLGRTSRVVIDAIPLDSGTPLAQPLTSRRLYSRRVFHLAYCVKPGSDPKDVVKRVKKDDVQVNFARSGGAGGQNVNKVNTKVDMRLKLDAEWISEDVRDALQRLEKKKINKEGELVLTSQKTRSQADNVEDALDKMQDCLDRAAESIIPPKPDPEKAKEIEKRKKISNEHRIQNKKMKSEKKSLRRGKIEW